MPLNNSIEADINDGEPTSGLTKRLKKQKVRMTKGLPHLGNELKCTSCNTLNQNKLILLNKQVSMSAWIRASKVRHVHGTVSTPENSYSELSPYIPVGDSNLLSCSSTHFAFLRSDKNISVVPLSNTGKLGGAVLPTFQHTSAVEAFQVSRPAATLDAL